MPAKRRGMRRDGSAVAGQSKFCGVDEAQADGREDGEEEKDSLECCFRVIGGRLPIYDAIHDVLCGDRGGVLRFHQLAVRPDDLFGLLPIFTGRKEAGAGISVLWAKLEAVHKVVVEAKRRKLLYGRAFNEKGKGNGVWKDLSDPGSKACPGFGLVEEKDKKDERAQDLSLVSGRPAGAGIKGHYVLHDRVKGEVKKHLPFFFIGSEKVFGVVAGKPAVNPGDQGSVLVMALPKFGFEHKCVPLCLYVEVEKLHI